MLKVLSSHAIFTSTGQRPYVSNISDGKLLGGDPGMDTILITDNSSIQISDRWCSCKSRVLVVCVNCSSPGFFIRSHFDNVFAVTIASKSSSISFFDARMWNRPDEELPLGTCMKGKFTRHLRPYDDFGVWSRGVLRGFTLRIATAVDASARASDQFTHYNGTITGGLTGTLLLSLRQVLGFDYQLVPVDSAQPWDAMAALVAAGSADVPGATLMATPKRQRTLRFSHPTQQLRVGVALRRPSVHPGGGHVLRPFTTPAWIGVGVLLALLVLALLLAGRLERLAKGTPDRRSDGNNPLDTFFAVVGLVCQQGTELDFKKAAARMALLSGLLGTFVLYAIYSAVLLSFLAVQVPELPFESLEDLRDAPGWRYIAINSALRDLSPMPNAETGVLADGYGESVRRLMKEDKVSGAVIADTLVYSMGCKAKKASACSVCVMPMQTSKTYRGLAFRPGFPHYHLFNELLMRLRASGTIQRLVENYRSDKLEDFMCPGPDDVFETVQHSIGFSELYQCFGMLAVGIILSLAVLVIERNLKNVSSSVLPM